MKNIGDIMLREFIDKICSHLPPSHLSMAAKGVWIYQNHFCKRSDGRSSNGIPTESDSEEFKKNISIACEGLCQWRAVEEYSINEDRLIAKWNGVTLSLNPSQWRNQGNKVEILLPYYAIGEDGWLWVDPEQGKRMEREKLARFYVALAPQSTCFLITKIRSLVNQGIGSFRLKLAWKLAFYSLRRDSCVIYFDRETTESTPHYFEPLFLELHTRCGLTPEKIPMTRSIAPGVYYAEDPITGESFGRHRCDLIARGIDRCRTPLKPDSLYQEIQAVFREEGFLPEEPWKRD